MNVFGAVSTSLLLAQAVLAFGLGCGTRAGAVTEGAGAEPAAVRTVEAEELAEWRATVGQLKEEMASLAEKSGASADETGTRLRALAEQLATLERRISARENATQANKIVVDGTGSADAGGSDARRDDAVAPAHLEVAEGLPRADHPFLPAIKRAKDALKEIEAIKDYSAVLVKQVRIDGRLNEMEFLHAKIRQEPLSVYLRFLAPQQLRDREVIYIEGQNNGNLLAHESPNRKGLIGILSQTPLVGTTSLAPTSPLAMVGNRYPITEIGILNLTRKLVEVGEHDMRYDGAEAKFYPNAKVDDRECEAFVFIHPEPREEFTFHRAEVFIDKKLNLPIRYVSYSWPEKPGETPPLIESYTYTRLKLDVGLTDEDFDTKNPNYKFPQ